MTGEGTPVEGAEVSLDVLTNDVMGHFWTPADTELLAFLEDRTRRILDDRSLAMSNAEGFAHLEVGRKLERDEGWVLWVTHSGHAPAYVLETDQGVALPEEVELTSRLSAVASVVDADGVVGGAAVHVQALPDGDTGDPDDVQALARRALFRSGLTDPGGRYLLPGTAGRSAVWATAGAERSIPVLRSGQESVQLELRPTFILNARVDTVGGAALGEFAVVEVIALLQSGEEQPALVQSCPPGGFAGLRVPLPAGVEQYTARLRFGEAEVCVRTFAAPEPGETVELEFEVRQGINHWFQVRTWGSEDEGIAGSELRVEWQRDGGELAWLTTRTSNDGYAQVQGLPIGVPIVPTVSGVGLETITFDGLLLALEDHEGGTSLDVERGGTVRVRVTGDAGPVNGCSFGIWDDARASAPLFFEDVEGVDGWHELAGVPRYSGSIAVVDGQTLLSRPARLKHLDLNLVTEAELELAELVPLVGRAVDAATGAPVPGALLWLQSFSGNGQPVAVTWEPIPCGDDGRFEARYPRSPRASVHLFTSEPRKAVRRVEAALGVDGRFDFGDVPLHQGFELSVQVAGIDRDADWTQYLAVSGQHQNSGIETHLDATGRGVLEVPRGTRSLTLYAPREIAIALSEESAGAARLDFNLGLYTEATLWVEVVDEFGEAVQVGGALLMWGSIDGVDVQINASIPAPGLRVGVPRPPLEQALLTWTDPRDPDRVAVGRADFSGDSDVEARLVLQGQRGRVRVVSTQGLGLADVSVSVTTGTGEQRLHTVRRTDEEGIAELLTAGGKGAVVLFGGEGSLAALGEAVDLPAVGELDTWVLEAEESLRLRCTDSGEPVPYAGVTLRSTASATVVDRLTGDSLGRVERRKLGRGSYRVLAESPGRFPGFAEVSVPGDEVPLELRRTGDVSAVVLDGSGAAAVGTSLELYNQDLGESYESWRGQGRVVGGAAVTDSEGRFLFGGVPHGSYAIRAGSAGWFEFDLEPGGSIPVLMEVE